MKNIIASQYHAALGMLKNAVEKCPDDLWVDQTYTNPFWQVAYHTLFYVDLYLSENLETAKAWEKHRPNYDFFGNIGRNGEVIPERNPPYTQIEILEYLTTLRKTLLTRLETTDLNAPSGFPWLPFDKLELQFYNIRHIQHHAGQLIERVRENTEDKVTWIRMGVSLEK